MSDCDFKTLLPDNRTALEVSLEKTLNQKYCKLNPEIILEIQAPWKCPMEFLPWLAYAYSVDVWNESWPEQTKRSVIANAFELHKHKGTMGGLEDALAALGVRMELVEWFDMQPVGERGTIQLTLWINDNINPEADVILGSETIRDIVQTIRRNKRHSIHYTFRAGVEASTGLAMGMTTQMTTHHRVNANHIKTTINASQNSTLGIATSAQLSAQQRLDAGHRKTVIKTSQPAALAMAASAQITTNQRMNAKNITATIKASKPVSFFVGLSAQLTTHLRIEAVI